LEVTDERGELVTGGREQPRLCRALIARMMGMVGAAKRLGRALLLAALLLAGSFASPKT
jgi:hypothetical protein